MSLTYFTVTGSFKAVISDGSDSANHDPEVQNISGLVLFSPSVSEVVSSADGVTYRLQPVRGRIEEDGILKTIDSTVGVGLVANTAALGPLEALTYKVEFSNVVYDKGKERRIEPFRFAAPTSAVTIDLATVTRLPV